MIFPARLIFPMVLSLMAVSIVQAEDSQSNSQDQVDDIRQPGWLGIWVRPLPAELKSQLAPLIAFDEGLLVEPVEKGSPADVSGVRQYDVLLSFGGQKLYSPKQLSSLVQNFNANSKVELTVIQQGQLRTLNSTLSANSQRTLARTQRRPHPYTPGRPLPAPPPPPR